MEKRRFGRSGHMSTVAIFGAFAFSEATQAQADAGMEKIIAAGVNHIDVAMKNLKRHVIFKGTFSRPSSG